MTKREVVAVSLRLFAIYIVLYTLWQVVGLLTTIPSDIEAKWTIVAVASILVFVIVAVILWRFSVKFAGLLLPSRKQADEPSGISQAGIEAVAFTILGLYVLSNAFPAIFYWSVFIHRSRQMTADMFEPTPADVASVVSTVVQLIIGLWLLFGAKGLRSLLRLTRTTGSRGEPSDQ